MTPWRGSQRAVTWASKGTPGGAKCVIEILGDKFWDPTLKRGGAKREAVDKNKKVRSGQSLPFSKENKRTDLVNKCFDVYKML